MHNRDARRYTIYWNFYLFWWKSFFFYKGAVSSLLAAYTIVYDLSKLSQKKKKKKRVTVRTRHRKATYDDIYFQMKIMS